MAKPSYKMAREKRKGSGTMEIEPADPKSAPVIDLTNPEPHSESLAPPLKPGQGKSPKIGPTDGPDSLHAEPGIVHEGDYARPKYTGISKT